MPRQRRRRKAGVDANTLGLLFDVFKNKMGIGGGGFVENWPGHQNTVLSRALLAEWAKSDTSPQTIRCAPALSDGKPRNLVGYILENGMLRDRAASLALALGNRVDRNFRVPSDSAASVAFHHDQLDHTANTFTMHAALGLGFVLDDAKNWRSGFIPFLGVARINNSSPATVMNNTTDFYAGTGLVWTYRDGKNGGARFSVMAQGDTDGDFSASILYVAGQFSPWMKGLECLNGKPQAIFGLALECGFNFDLDYAHVFNRGGFADLNQSGYARAGFDLSATIHAPDFSDTYLKQSGPAGVLLLVVRNFSLGASYKHLRDLTGTDADLARFESRLAYKIDSDSGTGRSTSVELRYVNGKADRTLERQRYWELALTATY